MTACPEPAGLDVAFAVHCARSGRTIQVDASSTVVEALADAGIEIPTSCLEGICGTCETRVLGGTPDHRDTLLTDSERAANDVMYPCVSRAIGPDLVLDL